MATKLTWDETGRHFFETGVDHGVFYGLGTTGKYDDVEVWNGLTSVSESPSGADASDQYADNIKYLSIRAAETFGGTIEAFSSPVKFQECDGRKDLTTGVTVGQQARKTFGLSYRTLLGNDTNSTDYGYKLHLVYGASVSPSERQYQTVNDSPEPITMSWSFTTTPVTVNKEGFKPTSLLIIDSTLVDKTKMAALEAVLYGSDTKEPYLPLPDEVLTIIGTAK